MGQLFPDGHQFMYIMRFAIVENLTYYEGAKNTSIYIRHAAAHNMGGAEMAVGVVFS